MRSEYIVGGAAAYKTAGNLLGRNDQTVYHSIGTHFVEWSDRLCAFKRMIEEQGPGISHYQEGLIDLSELFVELPKNVPILPIEEA